MNVVFKMGWYRMWDLDFSVINKLDNFEYVPSKDDVFKMFELLPKDKVKVIIMGSEPYDLSCPISRVNYACGPAFVIPDESLTLPVSLKNMFIELSYDIGCPSSLTLKTIKNQVKNWISQGVFLTNVSLTRGKEDTYLDDHKMLWYNFTVEFLRGMDCPVVLLGDNAWEMDRYIHPTRVLKLYHPANRSNKFFGCQMFTKINSMLDGPITWFL